MCYDDDYDRRNYLFFLEYFYRKLINASVEESKANRAYFLVGREIQGGGQKNYRLYWLQWQCWETKECHYNQ